MASAGVKLTYLAGCCFFVLLFLFSLAITFSYLLFLYVFTVCIFFCIRKNVSCVLDILLQTSTPVVLIKNINNNCI